MKVDPVQKKTIGILLLLSLVYFLLFIPPNIAASKDLEMVSVFEPDEAVPLPYVLNMIRPAESLKNALIQFAFYKYYFYGFPYFAYSAVVLLPLQWLNQINNLPLVMVFLRQLVSLLPLLAAIWVLVYLQTHFRGYRAILLFIFLAILPVVVRNNFWWHPDGLAILFAMLAIFFLERDDLRFGRNFYFSAAMCGFSAAAKGVGFFMFLAILVYLVLGIREKKIEVRKIVLSAIGFLGCMFAAYLLVFPTLIYAGVRDRYFQVLISEYSLISQGYEVEYAKGIGVALPAIINDYAGPVFLLAVLSACIVAIHRNQRRLLHITILAWLIPITLSIFFFIHYKFQYWLPVALPLFSSLIIFFPEKVDIQRFSPPRQVKSWLALLAILVVLVQLIANLTWDVNLYSVRVNREQNSPAIRFYGKVEQVLKPLQPVRVYKVYHDVRMYTPYRADWYSLAMFELLDYSYIQKEGFDVILLRQQRIYDYLNPNAIGLDPGQLAISQVFYQDAQQGNINGYHQLYRDDYGLIFIRDRLFENYFSITPAA